MGIKVDISWADKCQVDVSENNINSHLKNTGSNYTFHEIPQDPPEENSPENFGQPKQREHCLSDDSDNDEEFQADVNFLKDVDSLNLKDYSVPNNNITVDSPFLSVKTNNGKEKVIRKSAVCWYFNENKEKLSSDRLQRVQQSEVSKNSRDGEIFDHDDVYIGNKILINDLCVFQQPGKPGLIGLVSGFAYLDEKTWRGTEYSSHYANVTGNSRAIGVLCTYYTVKNNRLCHQPLKVEGFVDICHYKVTIRKLTIVNGVRLISRDVHDKIKKYL